MRDLREHALVLVNNHPSGDPRPSPEDIAMTRAVRAAGELVGIPLVDHVVVSRTGFADCPLVGSHGTCQGLPRERNPISRQFQPAWGGQAGVLPGDRRSDIESARALDFRVRSQRSTIRQRRYRSRIEPSYGLAQCVLPSSEEHF
ncbi:MAG TPA: JAB domain-containing protein [Polyangiaceae bacterium]